MRCQLDQEGKQGINNVAKNEQTGQHDSYRRVQFVWSFFSTAQESVSLLLGHIYRPRILFFYYFGPKGFK